MARKGLLRQVIFPVSWRGYCLILSPFLFLEHWFNGKHAQSIMKKTLFIIFLSGMLFSCRQKKPAMNMITGTLDVSYIFTDSTGAFTIDLNGYLPSSVVPGEYTMGIRPENIHGDNGLQIGGYYPVSIIADIMEPMGSDSYLYFTIGDHHLIARLRPETSPDELQLTTLFIDRSKLHFFHSETGIRL